MKEHHPGTSRVAALIIALVIVSALVVVTQRFALTTDLGVFLPRGNSTMEQVLMAQLEKGSTSNLVFAGIENGDADELAGVNRAFVSRLVEDDAIVQVLNGDTGLSEEDQAWVMQNRYHLTPAPLGEHFSVEGLKQSFEDRLRGLTSPLAALEKKFLQRDPTGEIIKLLNRWQGSATLEGPRVHDDVWFSQDLGRSLMIIELASGSFDLKSQQQAVGRIYEIFETVRQGNASLIMSGPAVFSVETRDVISADARMLTIVASTLVVLFLLLAFRSIRLLLLVLVPLLAGVVTAIAAVLLTFGSIHGITLAFGVTLTGVAVDYPIHFFSHLRGGRNQAEESIRWIWPTLRLGVISTVLAYVILMMSEFTGLKQLGLFTVVGLLMAAATTRWLLPFLIPARLEVGKGLSGVHAALAVVGQRLAGLGPWTLILIPAGLLTVTLSSTPVRDLDIDSLSPIGQERRNEDRDLRADLGFWYGGKLAVVAATSSEEALKGSENIIGELDKLIEEGALERYDMAASFIPSKHRQSAQIAELPDEETLRARMEEALKDSPFKKGIFEAFVKEVGEARSQPLIDVHSLGDSQMGERLKALLFEHKGLWIAPILLHGVKDEKALARINQETVSYQVIYLNIKAEAKRILETALDNVLPLLVLGVGAIYLLLALGFRSLWRPIRVLAPTLSAVAVTLAILNLAGISLTLMHMVSLLLIIGLGLDYALFYDRLSNDREEWHTTFKALWVSSLTTIFVFGILWFSNTPPLQAIGITVGIGAFMCLLLGACWTRRDSAPQRRHQPAP